MLQKVLFNEDKRIWDDVDGERGDYKTKTKVYISFGKTRTENNRMSIEYMKYQSKIHRFKIFPGEVHDDSDSDCDNEKNKYSCSRILNSPGKPRKSKKEDADDTKKNVTKAKELCLVLQQNSHAENIFYRGMTDEMEKNLVDYFLCNTASKAAFRLIENPSTYLTGLVELPMYLLPLFNSSDLCKNKFSNAPFSPVRDQYPLTADNKYQPHPRANSNVSSGNVSLISSNPVANAIMALAVSNKSIEPTISTAVLRESDIKFVYFSRDSVSNSPVVIDLLSSATTVYRYLLKIKDTDIDSFSILCQNRWKGI